VIEHATRVGESTARGLHSPRPDDVLLRGIRHCDDERRLHAREAETTRMTDTIDRQALDQLGPVDWLVVQFPGTDYGKGQVAPFLQDLVERDLVRVLDLLFIRKDAQGELEVAEISDLDTSELGDIRTAEKDLAMVLSEQDLEDLATTIEPGTSAAVLVWENLWAAPFGAAVPHARGEILGTRRKPTQSLLSAIEADK
jgi:hypothetical protein